MKLFALSKERILAISKFDALYENTQRWDIFIKCHCCDGRRRNEESGLFNTRRSQIVRYCIQLFVKYFQFKHLLTEFGAFHKSAPFNRCQGPDCLVSVSSPSICLLFWTISADFRQNIQILDLSKVHQYQVLCVSLSRNSIRSRTLIH